MSGLSDHFPEFAFGSSQVAPSEIDAFTTYEVIFPGTSLTWVGTAQGGTNAQAKPLVIINQNLDYPRNLAYSVNGTNDVGGTWVVNGKDQFGAVIQETVGSGTVAGVSPAFNKAGTAIFAQVTSGTFTFAVGSAGNGSAQLGVAAGGTAGSAAVFGLPVKIGGTNDVKRITHLKNFVNTTLGGGTIGALVGTARHTFQGTAALGSADIFVVTVDTTYNNSGAPNMTNL